MKKRHITALLILFIIVINRSTTFTVNASSVTYQSFFTSSGEPLTSATAAPEPSQKPTKTPEKIEDKEEEIEKTKQDDIDYTPYLLVIIFLLSGILGVLIGHFIIYRIK